MTQINQGALEQELREVIAGIVEIGPDKITLDAKFIDDLGMDSMMALEILAAMEKKYKIQIPEERLGQMGSLKQVIEVAKEYVEIA